MLKKKIISVVAAFISFMGIIVCVLLTIDHIHFNTTGSVEGNICRSISESGCFEAHKSRFSEIFGFPITLYGIALYFSIMILSFVSAGRDTVRSMHAVSLLRIASVAMIAYSVFLASVLYLASSFCPMCIALYGVNITILLCFLLFPAGSFIDSFRQIRVLLAGRTFLYAFIAFAAISLVVFPVYHYKFEHAKTDAMKKKISEAAILSDVEIPSGIPVKGSGTAKIKIIEISDLECPYCESMFFTLEKFYNIYRDDTLISFLHYPLDTACNPYISYCLHATACNAAKAAICANSEGLFFEYASLLYQHRERHDHTDLLNYAESLGINRNTLDECMKSKETLKRLADDINAAHNYKIRGTPTIFINRKKFEGSFSLEELEKIISAMKK
jgi:protein-disulfide isomerase/uncharacterized membrane protein